MKRGENQYHVLSKLVLKMQFDFSYFLGKGVLIVLISALLIASSCVSNRQITYLQYQDEVVKSSTIVTDSIIRIYETGELRYTLQPNDILSIRIATTTPEEYNPFAISDRYMSAGGAAGGNMSQQGGASAFGYRIDPFGYLNLPVVGKIKAQGLTIDRLEDIMDSLAVEQLEDPVTKISLLNFRFSVLGEVGGEGVLQSGDNSLTMIQAIAMAGGPAEYGDISKVKVIRKIENETYVYYVNLLDETFLTSEFYFVFPNDVIIVPPLKSRIYFKYISPNISIIASTLSLAASIFAIISIGGAGGN